MKKGINKCLSLVLLALSIMLMAGCSAMMKAQSALDAKDYNEAVTQFRVVLKEKPNDLNALKGIGAAYLNLNQSGDAVAVMEKAYKMDPADPYTIINLGAAYMQMEEYGKAIAIWKTYANKNPDTNVTDRLKKYLTLLLYKEAAKGAKEAVRNEKTLTSATATLDSNTLAVTYFGERGLPEKSKPLQKALASMLITDLSKAEGIKVVDRIKLQKLLDEMKLSASGMVDTKTAPRIGRLLGAEKIVSGNIGAVDKANLNIASILSSVPTSRAVANQDVNGTVAEFLKLEKTLSAKIIGDLKKAVPREDAAPPSITYDVLLSYGEGLDAQDMGNWDEAIRILGLSYRLSMQNIFLNALLSAPTSADAALTPAQMTAELLAALLRDLDAQGTSLAKQTAHQPVLDWGFG